MFDSEPIAPRRVHPQPRAARTTIVRALLVAAVLAAWSHPALADRDKALALYEKGTIAYNLREFRAAIGHYEAAYKEYPAPEFLFNIAQAYRQLDDCDQAVHFYRRYLALKPNAEEKAEVQERIADLEARCKDRSRVQERPPEGTQAPTHEASTGANAKNEGAKADSDGGAKRTEPGARETAPQKPKEGATPTSSTALGDGTREPARITNTSTHASARATHHLLFASIEGGIAQLTVGSNSTVQPSVRAGIGFGITEGALEVAVGPLFTWAELPWVRGAREGKLTHFGVLADVSLMYRVFRALSLRVELGGGAAVITNLEVGDPFLAAGADKSTLALFAMRAAIGADVDLGDVLYVSLTPFALTYSPTSDDFAPDASAVRRIDASVGLGVKL